MKYLILAILFTTPNVFAQSNGYCTDWEKNPVMFCYFNGQKASLWERQCQLIWDKEEVCMKQNPNELEGPCTSWEETLGTCWSGKKFEQEWVRECTDTRMPTQICSDSIPQQQQSF